MTKREELENVIKQLNDITSKHEKLYEESFNLSNKRQDLGFDVLLEEKLLKGTKWEVFYHDYKDSEYFKLDYVGEADDEQMNKVSRLLKMHHHDRANINRFITLKLDDSDASIEFKKIEALKQFIIDYEIVVSFDNLKEKIEYYSGVTKELKKFIKKFNG